MKCDTTFYLKNIGQFESRSEARFFIWCCERDILIQSKPPRIYGFGDSSWAADFLLPEINVYVEIKPLQFWFETQKTKRIIINAITRGEHFWVWFVDNEWKKPKIYEWTCYRKESSEPIEKQMQTFIVRDHPEDLQFLDNESQLLLF